MLFSRREIRLSVFAYALPWIALTSSLGAQTLNEQVRLVASDTDNFDFFGYSVSISGDTAVVGAFNDTHAGGFFAGSAYVFVRNGMTWTEQAKLVASDAAAFDGFGASVSISGDTAVVGAANFGRTGSAYVFVRNGTIWTQQTKLVASDAANDDYFGFSVSTSGDTAVVGAPLDDHGGGISDNQGSAYVFVRNGTSWTQQANFGASDAAVGDEFGRSVSISGDTAVFGAPLDDYSAGTDAGSAYVFVRSGTSWTQQANFGASDAATGDEFGMSVSITGDTALVGASLDDQTGGADVGSACVFVRSGTSWTQQAKLVASDAADSDAFGISVSISGDTAVVGALLDDQGGGTDTGSAYVFVRNGTIWTQEAMLVASDSAEGDYFGHSVSVSGDTAVVGAYAEDHSGGGPDTDEGSAYVYCLTAASATIRNAGSNPPSYLVKPPVLGGTFPNVVDLSMTGHSLALVFAFDSPFTFTFPGGQVILCFDLGGSGELLQQTPQPGPLATFNIPVPLDVSLCGLTLSSQALHFGTVIPFALSNAQDLIVGI